MYLLDTNVYIRYLTKSQKLPSRLRAIINAPSNTCFVSAVVPWEMTIKNALGKLPEATLLIVNYEESLIKLGMRELPIAGKYGIRAGQLQGIHRDPFDRMIIAQAQTEALTILTLDSVFEAYGVSVINK